MKVAIVHDWLVTYAGAERVLEQILKVFPQADLFSLVDFIHSDDRGFLQHKSVATSFVQRLPFARRHYRHYLPLMPIAVEQFDLTGYDLVISSSHAVAKGVITAPSQLHICMCYSPIRYAWDLQHEYLRAAHLDSGVRAFLARWFLHRIRMWDYRTANGVDAFIAISRFVAARIWKTYRRRASVIYPPVDVDSFQLCDEKDDFYLAASRFVPYKRLDLIIQAFASMPTRRLIVIGDGPMFRDAAAQASFNVTLLGYRDKEELCHHLQRARAFLFAAREDFGILPLEAQACGTPVIAYGRGGVKETVRSFPADNATGVFFNEQTPQSLITAVECFEANRKAIRPGACRANAIRFGAERFRREFIAFVESHLRRRQEDDGRSENC